MKRQRLINCCAFLIVLVMLISFVKIKPVLQENHPPVVQLLAPKRNALASWNTPVPYRIKVSDPEDGESAFAEIPANEVFLEVRYMKDTAAATAAFSQPPPAEPTGLALIKSSNCLNCHAFNAKLIGPSFFEISKRYPQSAPVIDSLVKHVREGSMGNWGNVMMPTHPELTVPETVDMVTWILQKGAEPGVSHYRGTEGYFTNKPEPGLTGGAFLLTATYTDHGLKESGKQRKTGTDRVVVFPN